MNVAQEIIGLLEEERHHLLSGDYSTLEELAGRKEEMARRLQEDPSAVDHDAVSRIAFETERNAELLIAARRGIEQAHADIRNIRMGMTQAIYGSDGSRKPLSKPPSKIEQKF